MYFLLLDDSFKNKIGYKMKVNFVPYLHFSYFSPTATHSVFCGLHLVDPNNIMHTHEARSIIQRPSDKNCMLALSALVT